MTDIPLDSAFSTIAQRVIPGSTFVRCWPLSGGVSAIIYGVEVNTASGPARFVVRCPGATWKQLANNITDAEFQLLGALHGVGLPVPQPLLLDMSMQVLASPFLAMSMVNGSTTILETFLDSALQQMATFLANLHRIDPSTLPLPDMRQREDPILGVLKYLPTDEQSAPIRDCISGYRVRDERPSVLHGDFWPGNLMWADGQLVAVIDWEDAAIGSAVSDVACCRAELNAMFGEASAQAFTKYYRAASGHDLSDLALWDIFVGSAALAVMHQWGLSADDERTRRERTVAFVARSVDVMLGEKGGRGGGRPGQYINLEAQDRFVSTALLRSAYIRYEESLNPTAKPFVTLQDGLELGIVSSGVREVARAVSSLLSRSLEQARDDYEGGHLPVEVVRRVQREIISPYGVANVWGTTGHRFVLSQRVSGEQSEVLATILVGRSKDTIFFLTGRYNNLRHSTIVQDVDFEQPAKDNPAQKWFDLFAFPKPEQFKPKFYHHIANFVVAPEHRNKGLARLLIKSIVANYARDHIQKLGGGEIGHSQYLLCGRGLWQIGDPPWLPRMRRLGFYLRWGAESFFMERDWAPLPPVFDQGKPISNLEYNRRAGLPEMYEDNPAPVGGEHLLARVPEVVALAQNPFAKLQYFQTMFDFTE